MKKTLILVVLFITISSSFAGQLIVSASGFYSSVPYETGTYDSVYISDYYNSVSFNKGSSNVAGDDSFSLTDILYTNSTGSHQDGYYYGGNGHWDPFPAYSPYSQTIYLGQVTQYSYVAVNLEVYGVDSWVTINY